MYITVGSRAPLLRYNDVWGNGSNYQNVDAGEGDIPMDPQFENEPGGDYRVSVGLPSLDAGNPDSAYSDRNGGRNDLGVYGGPLALPVVSSQATAPESAPGAFTVSWQGYASDGIQDYDVQYRIGDSNVWTDWLVPTPGNAAQFGPATPVSLTAGSLYCFRTRARDRIGRIESYPSQADACTLLPEFQLFLPVVLE